MRIRADGEAPVSSALAFLLAQFLWVLFGAPVACRLAARGVSAIACLGAAYGAGALALTVEATIFSLLGIPWTAALLAAPLLAASTALCIRWQAKHLRARAAAGERIHPSVPLTAAGATAAGLAVLLLGLALVSSRATSVDFLLFWGVKAVRFAGAQGIDAGLLGSRYFAHGQPFYPPLVPVTQAFGTLLEGRMPWRAMPLETMCWLVAALAVLFACLRRTLTDGAAVAAAAFWATALSVSLAHSYSGGNAEAPLLFYETVAGALLLTGSDDPDDTWQWRLGAGLALAGAVLTKVEGLVAAFLFIAAAALVDRIRRRRIRRSLLLLAAPPLAAFGLWLAFQWSAGLPLGYRGRGAFLAVSISLLPKTVSLMIRNLEAGTFGMSWAIPLLFLIFSLRRLREAAVGLLAAAGLMAFFAFVYLHERDVDLAIRIGWEIPRISQPALSLLILSSAIVSLPHRPARPAQGSPRTR
jgi:hypothetical protein